MLNRVGAAGFNDVSLSQCWLRNVQHFLVCFTGANDAVVLPLSFFQHYTIKKCSDDKVFPFRDLMSRRCSKLAREVNCSKVLLVKSIYALPSGPLKRCIWF